MHRRQMAYGVRRGMRYVVRFRFALRGRDRFRGGGNRKWWGGQVYVRRSRGNKQLNERSQMDPSSSLSISLLQVGSNAMIVKCRLRVVMEQVKSSSASVFRFAPDSSPSLFYSPRATRFALLWLPCSWSDQREWTLSISCIKTSEKK